MRKLAGMNKNRWWENYLVRYFLPSIFGMLVVWVVVFLAKENASAGVLKNVLNSFPVNTSEDFGGAKLILWALLGSLYCYISSYPILVFHATRSIDYEFVSPDCSPLGIKGRLILLNPYAWTLSLFVLVYLVMMKSSEANISAWIGLFVACYAAMQVVRIIFAVYTPGKLKPKANLAYAYLWKLSNRRVKAEADAGQGTHDTDGLEYAESAKDNGLVASYRHLREHSNTAFIIGLELICAPILYVSLKNWNDSFYGAWILGAWIFPAVLTYAFAQNLEYRFSWYGKKN